MAGVSFDPAAIRELAKILRETDQLDLREVGVPQDLRQRAERLGIELDAAAAAHSSSSGSSMPLPGSTISAMARSARA